MSERPRWWRRERALGTLRDAVASTLLRPFRRNLAARLAVARRGRRRTVVEYIDGLPILVLPDVFNPKAFPSGTLLAYAVRDELLASRRPPSALRVLDLGTGSGVCAVFAALRGTEVVAVDLNPQAVRCAQLNAQLHHVEDRMEARGGDLYAPVAGEAFDLITFNPPLYRGRPTTFLEASWQSEDVLERFAAGLRDHLRPGGRALVVISTDGAAEEVVWQLRTRGFLLEEAARQRWMGELTAVMRVERA